jgi:hypothetical protein
MNTKVDIIKVTQSFLPFIEESFKSSKLSTANEKVLLGFESLFGINVLPVEICTI